MSVDRNHNILDHGRDKTELLHKELMWIRALNSAYPLGLNDSKRSIFHKNVSLSVTLIARFRFHRNFAITMVDKASGNYAFTCKKLYLEFMEKELNTASNVMRTYEIKDYLDSDEIKVKHERFTRSFGITAQADGNLPKIYGIRKMHKTPIKFRFISGAHDSTLKPLSVELQTILRFLHGHFRRYCNNITSHDKINRFFSIQNTFKVVQQLSTVNNPDCKIFCADFSSLFTNLPHDVVKEKLF
ncbi:hypothetical protein PENTCL1PPCAC_28772 [Pristionchus entomophagus]|uniref:Reverse transcriptase domain-containing protein n=1 Tax=Pristionchus entomophagus TaxID=358040 RepID=A0AAV5UJT3_9BILA|nr:hypothetical protein PENTCL1PPCAC_28772 [Pristionchus entomophagus]